MNERDDFRKAVQTMRELQQRYKAASDKRCFPEGLYDAMRAAEAKVDAMLKPPQAGLLFHEDD